MNKYIEDLSARLEARYAHEHEYLQAAVRWLDRIAPVIDRDPSYEKMDLLARMVEPEHMYAFLVPWEDKKGVMHTSHGYRVQFNSAMGPYKGGLRFHPSVDMDSVKFLGFEQTYKNALTGLPLGGASGGSDFDPTDKSRREIMRFCQSFMMQLYRYIGSDTDIPSGDLGVGEREIGFLYGEYKRLTGRYESNALTGKGTKSGGSEFKKEAAGCGAIYFLQRMLADNNDSIEGKTIAVSGFGNLAWGVCRKAALLGAKVVTLSGPDGYIYDPAGIGSEEKLDFVLAMRASKKDCVEPYADRFGVEFFPGEKPWGVPVDIAIPCAVQNEVDVEDAVALVGNRVKYYAEASTMATTTEAFRLLELSPDVICAGAKAAGSGGVILSALEMVQNSQRLSWSRADVDERLHKVIDEIYDSSVAAAEEYGLGYDLIGGNNIASFLKVSEAMIAQAL